MLQTVDRTQGSPPGAQSTTRLVVYDSLRAETRLFRELAPRFGIEPTVTEAPLDTANVELASGCRWVSVSHRTRLNEATLRALAGVGVRQVCTRSIGSDHLDIASAARFGITVTTSRYSPHSVADYTLLLAMMTVRGVRPMVVRSEVHDYRPEGQPGRELRDLTVGIVGTGRIGSAVIDRLRGFGPRILAYDRTPKSGIDYVSIETLVRRCDVVSLHVPLTPETFHLLDCHRIEAMPLGAVLVNTGRGALVDTEALASALERGRLGGAALDVLEGEETIFGVDHRERPVSHDLVARLHRCPNVVISPHRAYLTDHALRDIVSQTLVACATAESTVGRG